MQQQNSIMKYCVVFLSAVSLMFVLLAAAAMIPREAVRPRMLESAEYMLEDETFPLMVSGVYGSTIDHYADSVLLNIVYNLDENAPVTSALYSNYYVSDKILQNAREDFLASVQNRICGEQQYIRYWHGSAVFLRFFHLFWNIKQIYWFHALLLTVLSFILFAILIRNKLYVEAISLAVGLLTVCVWCVPFCLEYYWCFLIMMIFSIAGVRMSLRGQNNYGILFMLAGMLTAYLDFLSCETITLMVPLLLVLRIRRDQLKSWSFAVRNSALWTVGYAGCWAMKWGLFALILRQNVLPYVSGHIAERIGGSIGISSTADYLTGAVRRNIHCLFFIDYGLIGAGVLLCLILAAVVPVVTGKVDLRQKINTGRLFLFWTIGMVPYIRYLLLHNHSWRHYFFTYRAQITSALALCFVLSELLQLSGKRSMNIRSRLRADQ